MAEYLKLTEVARRLDVSEKTARRYVKSGALPSVFIGGAYRVSEGDLEEFLDNAKVDPGKAPASSQPSFDGLLEEEQRDYGGRVWERINLLDAAAEQWQRFVDERIFDLKKPDFELLKAVDRVSLGIVLNHGREAAAMKRASTDEERARLEQAERRLIDTNLEFWGRVENELARREVTDLEAFKAQRAQWEQVSRSSRTA